MAHVPEVQRLVALRLGAFGTHHEWDEAVGRISYSVRAVEAWLSRGSLVSSPHARPASRDKEENKNKNKQTNKRTNKQTNEQTNKQTTQANKDQVVVELLEVFKVLHQDKFRRSGLRSRSLTFQFLVVGGMDFVPIFMWQLSRRFCGESQYKGFFALFPKFKKVHLPRRFRVRGCMGTRAHPSCECSSNPSCR